MASKPSYLQQLHDIKHSSTKSGWPVLNRDRPKEFGQKFLCKGGERLEHMCGDKPDDFVDEEVSEFKVPEASKEDQAALLELQKRFPALFKQTRPARPSSSPFDLKHKTRQEFKYNGTAESVEDRAVRIQWWNEGIQGFVGDDYTDFIETCRQYDFYELFQRLAMLYDPTNEDDIMEKENTFRASMFPSSSREFYPWFEKLKRERRYLQSKGVDVPDIAFQRILLHAVAKHPEFMKEVDDIRKEFDLLEDRYNLIPPLKLYNRLLVHAANHKCGYSSNREEPNREESNYANMTSKRPPRPVISAEDKKALKQEICHHHLKGTCRYGLACFRSHGQRGSTNMGGGQADKNKNNSKLLFVITATRKDTRAPIVM
jgi:hypothetical protein